jgi:hypothetical protein
LATTALCTYNAGNPSGVRGSRQSRAIGFMANIFVCLFAVTLCLINAVIWAFMSEMLFVGLGWVGAAAFCLFLQKWSRF